MENADERRRGLRDAPVDLARAAPNLVLDHVQPAGAGDGR